MKNFNINKIFSLQHLKLLTYVFFKFQSVIINKADVKKNLIQNTTLISFK